VEYSFGWLKTILIYLVSGIGGNIFSDLTKPSDSLIKVGASTSLFGIIGVILAYVIINWRGLDVIGRMLKCQMIFITVVVVLFILILTPYNSNIDYMGHLGGFITGFLMIGIHQTIRNDTC
jgi:rhomboid protease GluP